MASASTSAALNFLQPFECPVSLCHPVFLFCSALNSTSSTSAVFAALWASCCHLWLLCTAMYRSLRNMVVRDETKTKQNIAKPFDRVGLHTVCLNMQRSAAYAKIEISWRGTGFGEGAANHTKSVQLMGTGLVLACVLAFFLPRLILLACKLAPLLSSNVLSLLPSFSSETKLSPHHTVCGNKTHQTTRLIIQFVKLCQTHISTCSILQPVCISSPTLCAHRI